jgi:hypothetical protein
MRLPKPVVADRTGTAPPRVRPWCPVLRDGRKFHWIDPEFGEVGFECPAYQPSRRVTPRSCIVLCQDIMVWSGERWIEDTIHACGICLPHGVIVTREPPALRIVVVVPLRVADQVSEATAA